MDNITKEVRTFILKYARKNEVKDDDNIFQMGFVNSLFAIQLIVFIEKEFSITVENSIFATERFNSINNISKYIDERINQKRNGASLEGGQ